MIKNMNFNSTFSIAEHPIGGNAPCYFIAEAGVAHFGEWDMACQLVDLAADAGADAFKTQFFDVDAMIAERASDWKDRLRSRNLTFKQARDLKDRCETRGLVFLATAHDETRINWLSDLDVPAIKVGSGERNNPAFVRWLARLHKPIILSTGMYKESDVVEAIEACHDGGCRELALLHCVTSYPTPVDQVNLTAMDHLSALFSGPVGYSDHTEDHLAVLSAVARGAKLIEKHITILRDIPNAQDWKVSAGPEDLSQLIKDIRRVEAMMGNGRKEPAPCERGGQAWALKSMVAVRDLPRGHKLAETDLIAKRPADGLPPNHVDILIGRSLLRDISKDTPVLESDVVLDQT